jgi:hypothetical protein
MAGLLDSLENFPNSGLNGGFMKQISIITLSSPML